jgi:hypothetical protein
MFYKKPALSTSFQNQRFAALVADPNSRASHIPESVIKCNMVLSYLLEMDYCPTSSNGMGTQQCGVLDISKVLWEE